jgi:hypothetical protein
VVFDYLQVRPAAQAFTLGLQSLNVVVEPVQLGFALDPPGCDVSPQGAKPDKLSFEALLLRGGASGGGV